MKYKELIEYFQQRFSNKVLHVVELDERNWPYHDDDTGKFQPYIENSFDVCVEWSIDVDSKWFICQMNNDDYKRFIRNKKIEELI